MPELPEVESVRRALAAHVAGVKVKDVRGSAFSLRRPLDLAQLRERLVGATLEVPRRVGKYLVFELAPQRARTGYLLIHLGMSGRLALARPDSAWAPHTHVVLCLESGVEVRYIDPRRFGLVVWVDAQRREPALERMGPDPLQPDFLAAAPPRLKAKGSPIKAALMDQQVVAGVGNIYACEALWRAGIRPSRPASRVALSRLTQLSAALVDVLQAAIEAGGTTLRDHASVDGTPGGYSVALDVYGREGEACRRCGQQVRRTVASGRSTFWCPGCQH